MDRASFASLTFTDEDLAALDAYRSTHGETANSETGIVRHSPAPPKKLETVSASDLQRMDLSPVRFAVEGLIPHGLTLLASPPKFGKSWLALALCLRVARGEPFLAFGTTRCDVLYLALEDSLGRLKSRMNALLEGQDAPPGFSFATSAPTLDEGLLDVLDSYAKEHPGLGLVVVDTLQKVRGASHGREGVYANDYRELAALKSFADTHAVAVVLVHHLRKMQDDTDVFARISGTTGVTGAADTMIVLTREKRGDTSTTMNVTGRDVEPLELSLSFDRGRWTNCGDLEGVLRDRAQDEYDRSPVVATIKRLLEQSLDGRWSGQAKDLIEAGRIIMHTTIANTSQELSRQLNALDTPLFEIDGIIHKRGANGGGGKRHTFYYARAAEWTEEADAPTPPLEEWA